MPAMSKISCAATGAAALMATSAFVTPSGTQTRQVFMDLMAFPVKTIQDVFFGGNFGWKLSTKGQLGRLRRQANPEGRSPTGGAEIFWRRSQRVFSFSSFSWIFAVIICIQCYTIIFFAKNILILNIYIYIYDSYDTY